MKIRITAEQLQEICDNMGDCEFVELIEVNEEIKRGDIIARFDGLDEESIIVDADGELV